ncbi:hypothetical protein KJ973_01250 [Patescibacteria group bacterium]|nr:hypothetical protein [Patescibacteria group bacterium]MBU1246756.1 hypothetical protein [Patescibacteria group bacterium]MBU1519306.1 hypothetical protein [Patescibacteria group bacterium]MBU1956550.1 hypothetical protein [Patescibacteria group bacterium]MBU2010490.1 hypothetical protein [Patescibacteria group bacterium]
MIKETEKRERFKRLATQRTNVVLKKLKILGNCSNRSTYEYTEDEVSKIFSEIDKTVKNTKAKFHFTKSKKFKL